MNPLQTLRVAIRALLRNKMRSFLTTLGIIIGVSAVIAMVAIGEGAKAQVEASFASMGSNLLIVLPGSTTSGGQRGGFGSMPTLTWDDLRAMRTEVPSVKYAAPQLSAAAQLMSEDQNWSTRVFGTTPEFFMIRNWPIAEGSAMSDSDVESGTKVVFLGQTVVDKLFGANANPVGQLIRIRNIPFEVKGVLAKKGQSPMGQDYDDAAYIPLKTFQTKIQGGLQQFIQGVVLIGATTESATQLAEQQVTNLLRDRHHIGVGQDDDFSIRNLTELASAQEQGTKTLTTLLASIAAVSLLVGGIGIMNIMLVSVTERTREIGVRMAVGAKPRNILAQFLVEALTLALAGGVIGVALGLLGAQRLATQFHWPMLIRPDIIFVSVAFSAMVGVVFGLYPARKASRLDPIDALRFE
ncbi:MAG TPA: ABC transporter permease [Thermoanaerobaculaceae bacterium]|nr:ABC transporter permease [Thermoanaerobaculaceae bacterium]